MIAERRGDRALIETIEVASPDRAAPFCPYFGRCGGCVAQHIGPGLYAEWKSGKLRAALDRAGLSSPLEPLRDAHGDGRRRVVFHARAVGGEIEVGFMAARSHALVPISSCPITVPALRQAPEAARALARDLASLRKPVDVAVTATLGGLDVELRGSGEPGDELRQALIDRAAQLDLARLALHGEVVVERRAPALAMGRALVVPPPGAFLQATEAGERALAEAVLAGIGSARRVADLFAGVGPFALRLAERAEVHAVDADPKLLGALDRARRSTPGLRPVTVEPRDLFRRPLLPTELARFEAVILDPPRAGAEAQVRQLIQSSLETVIMVSCDPGTFARDAAILAGGGFGVERLLPIDQFKWSAHLEMVGLFRRERLRRARRGGPPRRA